MTTALTFNAITLTPITHQNSLWICAAELAVALGYKQENSVSRLYRSNADEFTPDMTQVIEIIAESRNGSPENLSDGRCRIFSLRGCHLLAMFARTPVAKEFRKWVLNVLDNLAEQERARLSTEVKEIPDASRPSTPDSRKPLRALVHAWAQIEGVHHAALWPQVKAAFQLSRIDDLPEEWLPDALEWVQGKIDERRKALPPTPPTDKESLTVAPAALPFQSHLPPLMILTGTLPPSVSTSVRSTITRKPFSRLPARGCRPYVVQVPLPF